MPSASEIRQQFIDFFMEKCGHTFVPSSPCVPHDDPSLKDAFANAGMNQFKSIFLGQQAPDVDKWAGAKPGMPTRAANSQKCIRAGGKHNDLDDVGHDTYHHTFFEMLGNWSFGDYFKKEAIEWAWELLTNVWGIDGSRLHATYFEGDAAEGLEPDNEARELWLKILPPERVHPGNKKDNFWEMGDTGPCGPCSELHIDLTPDKSGGPLVNAGDARVIEIWNLVFIQFNRAAGGKLSALPAKHVDTGMGFERVSSVLQGMEAGKLGQFSNYDTDIFTAIFDGIRDVTGAPKYTGLLEDSLERSDEQSRDRKGAVPATPKQQSEHAKSGPLPLAYFITYHTYGTWLHGSDKGSVDRNHNAFESPALSEDEGRQSDEAHQMKQPAFVMDDRQRSVVDATIREVCEHRGWTLHEINVRTNHVHVVVNADTTPERVMNDFKSYSTRRLREASLVGDDTSPWARHGSTRYLWKENAVAQACEYVREGQGADLATAPGDAGHTPVPLPDGRGSDPSGSDEPPTRDAVMRDVTYRVIADHIRTLTFALTDGAVPSNDGRGYVLRRILRRAVRYGRQFLGMHEPFLYKLVPVVAETMAGAFPELKSAHGGKNVERVSEIVRDEEASFVKTLDRGIALFEGAAEYATKHHHGRISGEDAFKMHDTFGFPIDLTELMAEERGLTVDTDKYDRLMEEAREKARAGGSSLAVAGVLSRIAQEVNLPDTEFEYGVTEMDECEVVSVFAIENGEWRRVVEGIYGQLLAVVLNRTPFYSEAGGQVGDQGELRHTGAFRVEDVQRIGNVRFHIGRFTEPVGSLETGDEVHAVIDVDRRAPTMHNHTATHILNWALRETLGDHVQQKGSLVDPDKTRFDLSHHASISNDELTRIETLVNEQIDEDMPVYAEEADQKQAREINTLRAVFGEKYPERVRVVSVGVPVKELLMRPTDEQWMKYSVEFCGGTHVQRTGEIQRFRLVEESAVAKGVRRVTGITGEKARQAEQRAAQLSEQVDAALAGVRNETIEAAALESSFNALSAQVNEGELPVVEKHRLRERLAELQEHVKQSKKAQAKASAADIMGRLDDILAGAVSHGDVKVCCANLGDAPVDQMRSAADSLRDRARSAAILLAGTTDDRVVLLAAMTKDVIGKGVKAGDLIKEVAPIVGGKGGGRPDMAQGGGTDATKIDDALAAAKTWIGGKLG